MMYSEHMMMAPPAAPILQEADPTVSFVSHFCHKYFKLLNKYKKVSNLCRHEKIISSVDYHNNHIHLTLI